MLFLLLISAVLLFAAWTAAAPFLVAWKRRKVGDRPFPAAWREILRRRVPAFSRLPADLQSRLRKHIQVFVAEKEFVGCDGLEVTDEMRVTIAAQACLLILNRADFYPRLRQILVYPSAFVVERLQGDGIGLQQESSQVLSGESWAHGQVVLSWEDVVHGAAIPDDGRNVVIHEFAHQLDQEKGQATGAPLLGRRERYVRWSRVLAEEFAALQYRAQTQQPSLFDFYGATAPAEFFAVVSEVFFEQPQRMAAGHPALYRELAEFYGVNPLDW